MVLGDLSIQTPVEIILCYLIVWHDGVVVKALELRSTTCSFQSKQPCFRE